MTSHQLIFLPQSSIGRTKTIIHYLFYITNTKFMNLCALTAMFSAFLLVGIEVHPSFEDTSIQSSELLLLSSRTWFQQFHPFSPSLLISLSLLNHFYQYVNEFKSLLSKNPKWTHLIQILCSPTLQKFTKEPSVLPNSMPVINLFYLNLDYKFDVISILIILINSHYRHSVTIFLMNI